ncbi:hypothetical protein P7C70_g6282, partial [Phenoliferia sp. Uapishka_3]
MNENSSLWVSARSFTIYSAFFLLFSISAISSFGPWQAIGLVGSAAATSPAFNYLSEAGLDERAWAAGALVAWGMALIILEGRGEDGKSTSPDLMEDMGEERRRKEEDSLLAGQWTSPAGTRRYYLAVYLIPILALILPFAPVPSFNPAPPTSWESQISRFASSTQCANVQSSPTSWNGTVRTSLSSTPRSGNTFVRSLVEEATGFQTSTISYCDLSLAGTFKGECDHTARFLAKTHYPERLGEIDQGYPEIHDIGQVVHLIRNPIDALYSWWHFAHVPRVRFTFHIPWPLVLSLPTLCAHQTRHDQLAHSSRITLPAGQLLGSTPDQMRDLTLRARVWQHHADYWRRSRIPTHLIRYEDLSNEERRLPTLVSLLSFLLPPVRPVNSTNDEASVSQLPDLGRLACGLSSGAGEQSKREAYRSRKKEPLYSWEEWDPVAREKVLEIVRDGWCRYGFDRVAKERLDARRLLRAQMRLKANEVLVDEADMNTQDEGKKVVVGPKLGDWETMCGTREEGGDEGSESEDEIV